jgi:hypothetical protein
MGQFLESAGIALRAIWEYKLRSFLTVLGNIVRGHFHHCRRYRSSRA